MHCLLDYSIFHKYIQILHAYIKWAWANSVDLGQRAPEGAVWAWSALFYTIIKNDEAVVTVS